ncbi:hypothetical protein SOCEGT47_027290 [Sorangium cellulosum]|uniref:Uncharacterized protein n=1 Tax=Sorangium cellulosum TaxID=56 RepID=A0A4P2Q000_SORCE|nr:hypothetical protein [Sorangium cellulosum]AUX22228.1 hypothetical protein SOCEGT47_027290 [Sorangium cellulosum]
MACACVVAAGLVAACEPAPTPAPPPTQSPPISSLTALPRPAVAESAPPTGAAHASNPLGLPPRTLKLDPGRRVFTVSDRMLAGAKLGSTLVLYAATVVAFEGDDLIIEGKSGSSYKVHPGYVIPVPDAPRLRPHDPVITEWNGVMKHAVITRFVKDKIEVRYTDMDPRTPLAQLKGVRFVRQTEGLAPGNFAAWKDGDTWRHVLLVSRLGGAPGEPDTVQTSLPGSPARWFALGYGGAALLADESALRPIPIRPKLKVGASVLAEWVGTLRPGVVQDNEETGLYTVKFERAGRPVTLGWGLLTPPLEP